MFDTQFLGYKKSTVDYYLNELTSYIDLLKKDIEFLKIDRITTHHNIKTELDRISFENLYEIKSKIEELL